MKMLFRILTILAICLSSVVYSNIVLVKSIGNMGAGTLREAVNNAANGDTIFIDVKGIIELQSPIIIDGFSEITIFGPSPKHNSIEPGSTFSGASLFEISNCTNVELKGLGFRNSNVTTTVRGIDIQSNNNAGGTIHIVRCLFEDLITSSDAGAAIYSRTPNAIIEACSFIDNEALNGGAIFFDANGPQTVRNCTFFENESAMDGGAIHVLGSTSLTLQNNTFKNNRSLSGQGEVLRADGSPFIELLNNAGALNGGANEMQFSDGGSVSYLSHGGNVFQANPCCEPQPTWVGGPGDNYSTGVNPGLRSEILEDGFGLKYFTIVNPASSFINAGNGTGVTYSEDQRKAPRIISNYGPFVPDAGACEYTPLRVTDNSGMSGPGTLYNALNGGTGDPVDYIEFDLGVSGPYTIVADGAYPLFTSNTVIIDAYSQQGSAVAGPSIGGSPGVTPAIPGIEIVNGGSADPIGLSIVNSDCLVQGLSITNFTNYGIHVLSSANQIRGCHIGVDATGSPAGNSQMGIFLDADDNLIGGTWHWERNVISSNGFSAGGNIFIGSSASSNGIFGNMIGVDPDGLGINPSAGPGIYDQGNQTVIGKRGFASSNIIGGNAVGIYLDGSSNASIRNNKIGVNFDGVAGCPNNTFGIHAESGTSAVIGGPMTHNIISGNVVSNVVISEHIFLTLDNNYIGPEGDGSTPANVSTASGIHIEGAFCDNILVRNNVISGQQMGIEIIDVGTNARFYENLIGLTSDGTGALPNVNDGIYVETNSNPVTIGDPGQGNIISGNGGNGINFAFTNQVHYVRGNVIGLNPAANNAAGFGNANTGVLVNSCSNVVIGGDVGFGEGNIISNNNNGIIIFSSLDVQVSGNRIGTGVTGNESFGNVNQGIWVNVSDAISIGGDEYERNIISGNGQNGILVNGVGGGYASIRSNFIGTNSSGSAPVPNDIGIRIEDDAYANIGGFFSGGAVLPAGASANVISGNTNQGILIESQNNFVDGNILGIGANDETTGMGNGAAAIEVTAGVNTIGGSEGNFISNNGSHGIFINGDNADDIYIDNNFIGLDSDYNLMGTTNGGDGIRIEDADNVYIGLGDPNEVYHNTGYGIHITGSTQSVVVETNYIGTYSGSSGGNTMGGVGITGGATNVLIGGQLSVAANYIGNNVGPGIEIINSDGNFIQGNFIGTNGTVAESNDVGIRLSSADGNVIGGAKDAGIENGNIISGNLGHGIELIDADTTTIEGNIIGLNDIANTAIPNGISGIFIDQTSTGNQLGLTGDFSRANILSGNTYAGLQIDGYGNFVHYNIIGLDGTGTNMVGAQPYGVHLDVNSLSNFIGGLLGSEGNFISNNTLAGIFVEGASNFVEGNVIGYDVGGTPIFSQPVGIILESNNCDNNVIGGTTGSHGNMIGSQSIAGIQISTDANTNDIYGNLLGIHISDISYGGQPLGIWVAPGAGDNNTIGGPGFTNVISGNDLGILIEDSDQSIFSNYIGTNLSGTGQVPNNQSGISIQGTASGNIIGGNNAADANIISGNVDAGIQLNGVGVSNNIIGFNAIGLGSDFATVVPNGVGVELSGGANANNVGVNLSGNGSTISGNTTVGIFITDPGTSSNVIQNNEIGTVASNNHGIVITNGASGNLIGGGGSFQSNVISGNDSVGVAINSANTNSIFGNLIGTSADGLSALPNLVGIYLNDAAGNNIGGNGAGEGNLVSANLESGIIMENGCSGNSVQNNLVGTDISGNSTFAGSGNTIGIACLDGNSNQIGGDNGANQGNVVCNNSAAGILLSGEVLTTVDGNNIGISKDNTTWIGNGGEGILLHNSDNNNIGLSGSGHENIVTANAEGIVLYYSNDNLINNNYVGNDAVGGLAGALSGSNNQQFGLIIDSTSTANTAFGFNIFSGNQQYGIRISGANTTDNTIAGNFVGLDITGGSVYPNLVGGILINQGASDNTIGGSTIADRNNISGNSAGSGGEIVISDLGTDHNIIMGNYIGVNSSGNGGVISHQGIVIDNALGTQIGGPGSDEGNFIATMTVHGIALSSTDSTKIFNNHIGVLPDATASGNGTAGVSISMSNYTMIGGYGVSSDSANIIANNHVGVEVVTGITSSQFNTIVGNAIYDNTQQGIDIDGDDAILPNNAALNPSGNNEELDFPEIIQAWNCGASDFTRVAIQHNLDNNAAGHKVQLYSVVTPDGNGHGEGDTYLGSWTFTPANGIDTIDIDLGQPLTVGTVITATMINPNGSTSEFGPVFTVTADPSAPVITPTDETCLGSNDGAIDINAPEAYEFSINAFSTTENGNQTYNYSNVIPGGYTVEVLYPNGCLVQDPITVNTGAPLTFMFTVDDDTCGLSVGEIHVNNEAGSPGPYEYNYSGTSTYAPNADSTGLAAGTYDVTIYDPVLGCYSLITQVTVNSVVDVVDESFVFDDFCPAPSVTPNSVATAGGTFTFLANPGDGSSLAPDGTLSNPVSGNSYTIIHTVGQCDEKDTVTVTALPTEDPSFTYDDLCMGDSPNVNVTTAGGSFEFFVNPGNGAIINPTTGEITGPASSYDVEYVTGGQCPDSTVVTVVVFDTPTVPQIVVIDSLYCEGETLQELTIPDLGPGYTYTWYEGSVGGTIVASTMTFTPASLNPGGTQYFLVLTDGNGCSGASAPQGYYYSETNDMYAGEDLEVCIGSEFQLDAYGGDTYLWSDSPNLSELDVANPTGSITTEETFIVTITNVDGCEITDSILVSFLPLSECDVDTYTAFSPNEDGTNDFWIIDGIEGYLENNVFIYNRWGDLVIELENYDNSTVVWDGSNNSGEIVPAGTYFYVVEVNGDQSQSGFVQVLK